MMFENLFPNKCIWLVGSGVNSFILFNKIKSDLIFDLSGLESYSFFDQNNYKALCDKDFFKFNEKFLIISQRVNWNKNLIIKVDVEKKDFLKNFKNCVKKEDAVYYVEDQSLLDLISLTDPDFKILDPEKKTFVKNNCLNLSDYVYFKLLSDLKINGLEEYFNNTKVDKQNILHEALAFDKPMSVLHYLILIEKNMNRKATLMFLKSYINDNGQVWDLDLMWKSLV